MEQRKLEATEQGVVHSIRRMFTQRPVRSSGALTLDVNAMRIVDTCSTEESNSVLSTSFTLECCTAKEKDAPRTVLWGTVPEFTARRVSFTSTTQSIIEECLAYENTHTRYTRHNIRSLPELCSYYSLNKHEIQALCYLVYECPHVRNVDLTDVTNSIRLARYICRERRHILRYPLELYVSFFEEALQENTERSTEDILAWYNACIRIACVVEELTPLKEKQQLLRALYALPVNVVLALAQGRTLNKAFLQALQKGLICSYATLQEYSVIAHVATLTKSMEYFDFVETFPILSIIEPAEYMMAENPSLLLLHIVREYRLRYVHLFSVANCMRVYIVNATAHISDAVQRLSYVNTVAQAVSGIAEYMPLHGVSAWEKLVDTLLELSEETLALYAIHPLEFIKKREGEGVYWNFIPILAYMQYNKEYGVHENVLPIMQYMPMVLYNTFDKPYEALQSATRTIVLQYPQLSSVDISTLTMLLSLRSVLYRDTVAGFEAIVREVALVIDCCTQLESIRTCKEKSIEEYCRELVLLPRNTLEYCKKFPEIIFSDWLYTLPVKVLNAVYKELDTLYTRNIPTWFVRTLIDTVSPLIFLTPSEPQHLIFKRARQCLSTILCDIVYTPKCSQEVLEYICKTIRPLYIKYPSDIQAHSAMAQHIRVILDIYYASEKSDIAMLCSKSKTQLMEEKATLQ